MEDRNRCRECGVKLSADAAGGLCPTCRQCADLASGARTQADRIRHVVPDTIAESFAVTSAPGALENLAETVAAIPRVQLRETRLFAGPDTSTIPSVATVPDASDHVSRLQMLGELARGGMGVIIKGRDSDLGRDLAVKVLLEQHRENPT
jgi:hypothetical protein